MNLENKKLGRGLDALIPKEAISKNTDSNFRFINLTTIKPNINQPRKKFSKKEIEELSQSIKEHGIIQPIAVRRLDDENYEIVAGERRWRAAQLAGIHEIPALIKDINSDRSQEAALIENIQRESLNAVEEAEAYKSILKNNNSNYDSLSLAVGKSKSHILNMIRILELDQRILNLIVEGKLSMGHARALIGVPNAFDFAKEIINKNLSVRQVEKNTSQFKKRKSSHTKTKDANILELENELSEKIGLKTSIHFNEEGSSGSITLYYSNLDQLDDVMKRLKK